MLKLNTYKKEKVNVINTINRLNKSKENILKKIKKLNLNYKKNKLSSIKYEIKLKNILDNKSFNSWINNNYKKIDTLERRLFVLDAKIKGSDKVYINQEFLMVLFLLIFSLSYFYLDASITGHIILDEPIIFNKSTILNLNQNINSLKLSGYIEGNGTAKIYLSNYLVFDNSQLSQNTENTTNNTSNSFSIQPILSQNKIEFNDICIETCNISSPEGVIGITGSDKLRVELNGDLIITITNTKYTLQINQEAKDVEENKLGKRLEAPIENNTLQNESEFTIPILNNTLENLTQIENTSSIINNISDSESLTQSSAEINKPVEWKLITKNKSIDLPIESTNIDVEKINETDGSKEPAKLKNLFSSSGIKDKKLIEIDEANETKLEVTYFTKAPYSIEEH